MFNFTRSGDYHLYSERELTNLVVNSGFLDVSWEVPDKGWFFLTASSPS
ncbi:MAG: hypothetical protein SWK76_12580 [Actinomycetota bacterium]|nr:hypothetical protein [Actinomycetota bacterium]